MGEKSNAFVTGLETAQQIIKISLVEIIRRGKDVRWFEGLSLFDIDFISAEELTDQQNKFEGRVGEFVYDVGEDVEVADVDEVAEKGCKLFEMGFGFVPFFDYLFGSQGYFVVVGESESFEHFFGGVEVIFAKLGD